MTVHHRLWLWPHLTLTGRSKPSGGLEVFFMSEPCIDAGRLFAVMPYHTICTHRIIPPWFPAVFSGMFWVLPNWFFCNLWLFSMQSNDVQPIFPRAHIQRVHYTAALWLITLTFLCLGSRRFGPVGNKWIRNFSRSEIRWCFCFLQYILFKNGL